MTLFSLFQRTEKTCFAPIFFPCRYASLERQRRVLHLHLHVHGGTSAAAFAPCVCVPSSHWALGGALTLILAVAYSLNESTLNAPCYARGNHYFYSLMEFVVPNIISTFINIILFTSYCRTQGCGVS